MAVSRYAAAMLGCALWLLAVPVRAQDAGPQHPGRAAVMSKCFQCHTDAMFRDHRTDRRGWEAAIYRMVGRGGLWTAEEIALMTDYLGTAFGPDVKPVTPSR
jgi:hypothetical protein